MIMVSGNDGDFVEVEGVMVKSLFLSDFIIFSKIF